MRINFKNKVYKTNDFLVEMYVGLLVIGRRTLEQVPDYGNLRAVVQGEVDRINKEAEERERLREEREKIRREALEKIQNERERRVE